MKILLSMLCLLALCVAGCDNKPSGTHSKKKTAQKGTYYFLSIASGAESNSLTLKHFTAATLLPMAAADNPKKTPLPEAVATPATAAEKPVPVTFTELNIDVIGVELLSKGIYRLQLEETPQVDGIIRIDTGTQVFKTLTLKTGSEKMPLRVDSVSTAAVDMFLHKVSALRSFNGADAEQVDTILSVVQKHLDTLDIPDKQPTADAIAWYTEQARKACTISFSELSSSAACAAFTLGGTVKGLAGQVQLSVNHGEPLILAADGDFMFRTGLINRAYYEVTVKEQPVNQTCVVKYGVGRIHGESVDGVLVQCAENRYQLSGLAEGITGTVKLMLNGKLETLALKRSGVFQFDTTLRHGAPYEITLADQPDDVTCALSRGAGYVMDNVADISVFCEPLLFQVGGTISDLVGTLKLIMNDSEELSVSHSGDFAFVTDFVHKAHYNARIAEQPAGQTCTLNMAAGKVALADVKNLRVSCVLNNHTLGGKVSGTTSPITLALNNERLLPLRGEGDFHFDTPLVYGAPYAVTVADTPQGQTCEVVSGTGTVSGDISDIQVNCAAIQYRIGGVVNGLSGAFQLKLNNSLDILAVPGNGPFSFSAKLTRGQTYNVVIDTQPAGQTCTVRNGTGRVALADVKAVVVNCEFQSYKLGGSLSGLTGAVKLALNGGPEFLTLSSNGMFAFSSELQAGLSYNVTVAVQPQGQKCEVKKGAGQINSANVVDVKVICVPLAALPSTALPAGTLPTSKKPLSHPQPRTSAEDGLPDETKTFAIPFPEVIKQGVIKQGADKQGVNKQDAIKH